MEMFNFEKLISQVPECFDILFYKENEPKVNYMSRSGIN